MTITILISDHPIESKNEKVIPLEIMDGDTLDKVVHLSPFKDFAVYHNDDFVYEEDFKHTFLDNEDIIILCPSSGLIPFLLHAIGSYFIHSLPSIILAISMSYLGGVLFNSQLPEFDESSERKQKQSYGWNPRTTRTEGTPIPWAIGTNAHYGNIVSQWTDVDDSSGNEVLYVKLALGEGPTSGIDTNTVWINGQPIGDFTDVVLTEAPGTVSQSTMSGFEQDKLELSVQREVTSVGGAYTVSLPRAGFDDVEWTLEFRGLYEYNDMGDQGSYSVTVKVEIADVAVGAWTTLFNDTITGNSRTSLYYAYAASDTSGFTPDRTKQYELRVTKMTADRDSGKIGDHLYLRSVRGVVDVAFTHPGIVLVGIKALATELLHNSLDIKVLHNDRILRYYDGSDWQLGENNNRAWGVYNILTQPIISGTGSSGDPWVVEAYEGFQPSQIDTAFFYTWAQFCAQQKADGAGGTEDAYPLDHIYDEVKELWSWAIETAAIGRAHLYWQGTILTGWVDDEVASTGDLICYQNIVEGSWRQEWTKQSDLAGGCIVTLQDSSRGYKNVPWPTYNEDGGTYTRTINIDGIGVKTRAFGSRIGEFVLERNKLIREVIKFTMIKDALLYNIGGVYPVQHRKPNWGSSYQVMVAASAADTQLTLDRTITGNVGDSLYIRSYDSASGTIKTEQYNVSVINDTQVTIDDSGGLRYAAAHGDVVAIGTTTQIKLRRIIGKESLPNHMFDITMETYDPDLFDVDDLTPTIPYTEYTPAQTENKLIQPATKWDAVNEANRILPPSIATDIPWIGNITWEVSSSGDITWTATDATKPLLFRLKGTPYEITAGSYTPGSGETEIFFYWDPNYTTIFRSTLVGSTAVASPNWMVATYKDGTIYPATPIQLLHAAVILAGTIRADQYAELRQTMPWAWEDSLDSAHPFTVDFHLPEELTSIVSVKLSFKIKNYRAYATTDEASGQLTSNAYSFGSGITSSAGATMTASDGSGTTGSGSSGSTSSGGSGTTGANGPTTTANDGSGTSGGASGSTGTGGTGSTGTAPGNTGSASGPGVHSHSLNNHAHTGPSHDHSLNSHTHSTPSHIHSITGGSHSHSTPSHSHTISATHTHSTPAHSHSITAGSHTHDYTLVDHTHTIDSHTHGLVFGIYEEDNAPITINYNIDNGSGFGGASSNYTSDQTDIDITASISGSGWKAIKFNADKRCRLVATIDAKVDITA